MRRSIAAGQRICLIVSVLIGFVGPSVVEAQEIAQVEGPHLFSAAAENGRSEGLRLPLLDDPQRQAEKPPEPAHTGLAALAIETGKDYALFPQRMSTYVILGLGGAAALLTHPADDDVNDGLRNSTKADRFFVAGKYLGSVYTTAGTAASLYVVGRFVLPHTEDEPRTNRVSHLGFDMIRAILLSQGLTHAIKITVRRDRPTGECCAFPSGHASNAFAVASVLERHLGYRNSWPMFAIGAYVAASRLQDNRHFLSDVMFGSAVGIASGWTVVGRHGRSNYALIPVAVPGGMMVRVSKGPLKAS